MTNAEKVKEMSLINENFLKHAKELGKALSELYEIIHKINENSLKLVENYRQLLEIITK